MSLRLTMIALAGALLASVPALADPPPATAPAQPSAAVQGMVGPALYVTNPERSLKFYIDGLGMKVRMRFGPADRPDIVIGFGTDMTQAGIMLITDKTGPIRPIEHSHGFDRIALRLPDLTAVSARLKAAGFEAGEIRLVHGAFNMMMITDPDGYRIELIDSLPPRGEP